MPPVIKSIIEKSAVDTDVLNDVIASFFNSLYTEDGLMAKVKFVTYTSVADPKELKKAGLCKMFPKLSELGLNSSSEKFGIELEDD